MKRVTHIELFGCSLRSLIKTITYGFTSIPGISFVTKGILKFTAGDWCFAILLNCS